MSSSCELYWVWGLVIGILVLIGMHLERLLSSLPSDRELRMTHGFQVVTNDVSHPLLPTISRDKS